MACSFMASYSGNYLGASQYAIIMILTIILCFGLPSLPSSSIIVVLTTLNAIKLSSVNIALLYTVEWYKSIYFF